MLLYKTQHTQEIGVKTAGANTVNSDITKEIRWGTPVQWIISANTMDILNSFVLLSRDIGKFFVTGAVLIVWK